MINRNQLYDALIHRGIQPDAIKLSDQNYDLVLDEFLKLFKSDLKSFLDQMGVIKWRKEAYDCDDYARAAVFYANLQHSRASFSDKPRGIAFGQFHYCKRHGDPHALNVFLDEKQEVRWWEPQTGEAVRLSEEEIQSSRLCFF